MHNFEIHLLPYPCHAHMGPLRLPLRPHAAALAGPWRDSYPPLMLHSLLSSLKQPCASELDSGMGAHTHHSLWSRATGMETSLWLVGRVVVELPSILQTFAHLQMTGGRRDKEEGGWISSPCITRLPSFANLFCLPPFCLLLLRRLSSPLLLLLSA